MPDVQQESTGLNGTDRPGSYSIPRLGVDAKGRTHYFHDEKRRVLVYDESGEVVHTEDLNGRELSEWTDYVAASIGWEQAPGHWVEMLTEALAREEV